MDWQGSQGGNLTRESTEHHVSDGGDSIHPFPLGDLLSRRHRTIHVVLPLHCDGVFLVFTVGSNVVHLGDGAAERRPGAANVESGFVEVCFFHTCMMAQIQDLVVHGDTELRKRILRLLVPIGQVVGRLTWVTLTVHPLSVNNRCRR